MAMQTMPSGFDHIKELAECMANAAREYALTTRGAHAHICGVTVEAKTNAICIVDSNGIVLEFIPEFG